MNKPKMRNAVVYCISLMIIGFAGVATRSIDAATLNLAGHGGSLPPGLEHVPLAEPGVLTLLAGLVFLLGGYLGWRRS